MNIYRFISKNFMRICCVAAIFGALCGFVYSRLNGLPDNGTRYINEQIEYYCSSRVCNKK